MYPRCSSQAPSAESLKRHLAVQTSTILTADSTRDLLRDRAKRKQKGGSAKAADDAEKLLKRSDEYVAHRQRNLYRACASITAFKVRDPDPNAVDGGAVLGLRFEVMSKARFLRPYYVMLNRPYADSRYLRVHRHTVPPCIPLSGLAARHLPAPKAKDDEGAAEQDLPLFARALRRELVRYRNRISIVGDLHKAAGLDKSQPQQPESHVSVTHISPADAEAKQISIEWNDGKVGRLVMDDDGKIVKMAVQGENGRDRGAVRKLLGGSARIEEILGRLEGT